MADNTLLSDRYMIFIENNRQSSNLAHTECHHIVPRCLGGSDDRGNLVHLTYRDHFIAHKILMEDNPHIKGLTYAYWRMCNGRIKVATPEEYEEGRKNFSESRLGVPLSEEHKDHLRGPRGPMSEEGKRNISISLVGVPKSEEHKRNLSLNHADVSGEKNPMYGKKKSREFVESQSQRMKGNKLFEGRTHTEETKLRMSKSMRLSHADYSGENNPCYGRVCITNGIENKKVYPEELTLFLSLGYYRGITRKRRGNL